MAVGCGSGARRASSWGRSGGSRKDTPVDTLTKPETLGLSSTQVGLLATVYLVGEVVGALVFGALSDRCQRRSPGARPGRRAPAHRAPPDPRETPCRPAGRSTGGGRARTLAP